MNENLKQEILQTIEKIEQSFWVRKSEPEGHSELFFSINSHDLPLVLLSELKRKLEDG